MARLVTRAALFALLVFAVLPRAPVHAAPLRAAPFDRGVTVLHVAKRGPALVVGPQNVQRMTVVVRGRPIVAGEAIPVGASRLGHGVTAVQLPDDLRPSEPITVRVDPPGAGRPRVLTDDRTIDVAVASARADGAMIGMLLAVLVFQVAVWTIIREPSIPFYAVYILTFAAIELLRDGLLPTLPGVPAVPMLLFMDCVNGLAGLGFIIVYLRLLPDDPPLFRLLIGSIAPLIVVGLILSLVQPLQPYSELVRAPLIFAGSLVLLAIALRRARRFPPALSLASAMAFVFLGVVYRTVRDLTPLSNPFFDRWTFEISTTADAVLFGLAVIVRARYVVRERRALEARLDEATNAAEHDPLTGALNRRGLFSRVAQIASGALFFLDLDGFKAINDRFGHSAGDHVLTEVVDVLRRLAPEGSLIARIGGDEFVVVTRDALRTDALAVRFAEAIAAIKSPARLRGDGFGASLGVVALEGIAFENALRMADAKAYRAKSQKRIQ
jgi:diguanylate cyclase (GGDEF)-like protein